MVNDDVKTSLVAHLKELIRQRDPYLAKQGHSYVRYYMHRQLAQWGSAKAMEFTHQGHEYYNLCLELPGQRSLAPVIIGAHYDTVPGTPGADDNATGLAVLLELARQFSEQPPRRPVHLVAFDLEEYGLVGSRAYVSTLQGQSIHLMLSLEMLGYCARGMLGAGQPSQRYPIEAMKHVYPKTGDFIALIGNWQTIPTLWRFKRAFKLAGVDCEWLPMIQQGRALPDTRRSDHAPFWDAGYNAIMVTDTANLRNPHYHGRTDTFDTLDLDFLTQVYMGLVQGITQL
ncbi:MAG: M20/M25/M40 family metallo-hydrolase [Leptolyngbyaceae cyanobacterium MAG.088]|nr:M20/M25/M40 family metallo-hydrolase [Leptolyngbyaceae cyanobacterium MAG.088]